MCIVILEHMSTTWLPILVATAHGAAWIPAHSNRAQRVTTPRTATLHTAAKALAMSAADAKKVLVLISDTGGGHRASAQAIEAEFAEMSPELQVSVVDMWTDHTPWPYNRFVAGYKFTAKNPPIWWLVYFSTAIKPFYDLLTAFGMAVGCYAGVRGLIEQEDADLVVSMHPLCQDIPLKVLDDLSAERGDARTPFATVVTDLGSAHPTWFHSGVDACFVPSDAVRDIALGNEVSAGQLRQRGSSLKGAVHPACEQAPHKPSCWLLGLRPLLLTPERSLSGLGACGDLSSSPRAASETRSGPIATTRHGLPVRKDFYTPSAEPRDALLARLGLLAERKTVLLVGGGDGVGSLGDIVDAMAAQLGAAFRDQAPRRLPPPPPPPPPRPPRPPRPPLLLQPSLTPPPPRSSPDPAGAARRRVRQECEAAPAAAEPQLYAANGAPTPGRTEND